MKISLSNADELFATLYNEFVLGLLSKAEFQVFPGVHVTVPETVTFSLYREANKIVVELKDAKPTIRVGLKRFFNVTGTVTKVIIDSSSIVITVDGLPDITVEKA